MKTKKTKYPFQDKELSPKERVEDLLKRLTLDEKIQMLSTHQRAVERLGIKEWYIGMECARGYVTHDNERPGTVFPQPQGMASMFDPKLMYRIGEIAGNEFRAYYNRDGHGGLMVWGPTVDMERDPRWGRTEEAYGEDPFLTGAMTIAYTKGLRGEDEKVMKTVPTLKHFCADNNERDRGSCSANLEPRTKHEYYYAAFKPSITKGGAYSMMAAYNELSGVPAICNPELKSIIKDEWGLGFVVSDGGDFSQNVTLHGYCHTHAESLALSLKAGCDVMTDNADIVSAAAYEALKQGLITEADIDEAVGRSLDGRVRLGEFDGGTIYDSISQDVINCPEYRAVNLQAAKEGVTLLKNEGILPLPKKGLKKILVCGPLADENHRDWYTGCTTYEYSVLDGMKMAYGEKKVVYDNGYDHIAIKSVATGKYLTVAEDGAVYAAADAIGDAEIFEYRDLDFDVVNIYSRSAKKYLTFTNTVQAQTEKVFQWFTTEIVHRRDYDGKVTFESRTHEDVMVAEDGRLICAKKSRILPEKLFEIVVVSKGTERIQKAAQKADVCIVCVGNHPLQVARECWDRPDITLPKVQQEITKAAFAANEKTVSLIVSSYPFAVNWEQENLPAVVYTCHAGPELGTAVTSVLRGEYNPAGRTPMTWYTSVRELPDIMDYDIIANNVTYQYYDGTPLYPFGHGLSYSSFAYRDLKTEQTPESLIVSCKVKNTSDIDGEEVVQVYYHPESKRIKRPIKKLCGFERVMIPAGQEVTVQIEVDKEELSFWDVSRERFCVEKGDYTILVGASSGDIRLQETVLVRGEVVPARDIRRWTKAINYDRKTSVKMGWSKELGAHYIQGAGYNSELVYQDCKMDGGSLLEIKAASWEGKQTIAVYADSQQGKLLGKLEVCPTNAIDDFRVFTLPIKKISGVHDLVFAMTNSVTVLEFKMC